MDDFDTGDLVSAIALADSDRFLIVLRDRLAFLDIQTGEILPLYQIMNRFN